MAPLITREEALRLGELEDRAEIEALIELRRASFASQDMREGMRAFAERRPPHWQNE